MLVGELVPVGELVGDVVLAGVPERDASPVGVTLGVDDCELVIEGD